MPNIPRVLRKTKQATPNPRKVDTGTSYVAQGTQLPAAPQINSELGSALPVTVIELVPELQSDYTRNRTYAQMMNDASVDVSVRAWKTPVLGSDMYVDPYSDDPLDVEIADFIWANLEGGMSQPLSHSLEDILHMCEDGWSVIEKVYENREWTPPNSTASAASASSSFRNSKVFTMLKKLAVRPPSTLGQITYDDNGGPVSISQNAIRGNGQADQVDLPINKILVFTLNRKGGDLKGKSLLRTAYPHWYYKNHLYKIDAIQKERHGIGVPRGKLLPGYNEKDKELLRQMLRNLRSNEESFILQTPGIEIDFAELTVQPADVLKSAEHHNTMILLNVMGQFLSLGVGTTSSGGGRATGATQFDMFMKALRFIGNMICDQVNMYVIPELVVWNYKTTNFPQMKVRNIGETRDLQMLSAAIANLIAQGGITMDLPTEQWLRDTFDMPAKQAGAAPSPQVGGTAARPVAGVSNGAPQKGNVKPTTGTGNTGAPSGAPS